MRPAVAMLAIFTTSALSPAFADPPAAPPPDPVSAESRSPASQNSTAEASTNQNAAATHAVPTPAAAKAAETPAVAPAKPPPSASGERKQEQLLRNQGYKLSMVRGEEKYCRREIPVGSHLATVMHCVTLAEAELMAREARETAERIQRNSAGCLTKAMGACGN